MLIWLINPYGPIPSEAWRTYCYPQIAEALTESGHEVVWWTSNFAHHFKKYRSDGWLDIEVTSKFTIRLVPTSSYKNNIGVGRIVRDAIFAIRTYLRGRREKRPDLIISSESPLTFGYASSALASRHDSDLIYHQMDLWPELIINRFNSLFRPMIKLLFLPVYLSRKKVFNKLAASTALAAPYLEAMFKVAPSLRYKPNAVVYNGIDVKKFREQINSNEFLALGFPQKFPGDFWAIFAGSLGPSYDIDVLCETARLLKENNRRIYIVVAGDGPKRGHVTKISEASDIFNLYYCGQLSPDSLAVLYSKCDIGLCAYSSASNVEMPDKIYDYTAAGLPVVVSLTGEVADIVKTKKIGENYQSGSAESLYEKLTAMTYDPNQLKEMSDRSSALGMEFDRQIQYQKFVAIVDKVLTKNNSV